MNQGDVSFHPLLTILQTEDIVRHLVDFQVLFVSLLKLMLLTLGVDVWVILV